jgi:hypothetical protein
MSSLNHHAANAKRGPSALAHTGVSHGELYPHRKVRHSSGETLNYPVSSQTVLHKTTTHTIFQSTSSTDNCFSSGGFVDVRIPAGSLQVIKQVVIALEIENKTTSAITMPAGAPFLLDRVEMLAEGGNTQIARWEPFQLWTPFRHVEGTSWDLNWKWGMTGSTPTLGVGAPANTYYIPILGCPFSRNEAFLGHLRSDLYIRVWFKGPSAFVSIPDGAPSLNTLSCIIEQDAYAPAERQQLFDRAISSSLDYRFGRPGFQSIVETLAPSTRYSWMLTAVTGVVSEMIVTIRPANSSGANAYNFQAYASYELLDSAGSSLLGGMPVTLGYQKLVVDASRQTSGAIDYLSGQSFPIVIEFGSAKTDFINNTITGYVPLTGQERLVITTHQYFVPGSYEIRIEYLSACRLNINQGKISVLPS